MDNAQQPIPTQQQPAPPTPPVASQPGITPQQASRIGKIFTAIFILSVILMIAAFVIGIILFGPKEGLG